MDKRIEAYLAYIDAVRGLSERTVRSYREDLAQFDAFLSGEGREGAVAVDIDEARSSDMPTMPLSGAMPSARAKARYL